MTSRSDDDWPAAYERAQARFGRGAGGDLRNAFSVDRRERRSRGIRFRHVCWAIVMFWLGVGAAIATSIWIGV